MFQSKLIRVMFYIFIIMGAVELIGLIVSAIFLWDSLYSGMPFLFYIFIIHAHIFLLLGIIFITVHRRKEKFKLQLRKEGQRIDAIITKLEINHSVTVNMNNPYYIICMAKHTGNREYKSEDILGTPDYSVIGNHITVFLSKTDPGKYLVDISDFL